MYKSRGSEYQTVCQLSHLDPERHAFKVFARGKKLYCMGCDRITPEEWWQLGQLDGQLTDDGKRIKVQGQPAIA